MVVVVVVNDDGGGGGTGKQGAINVQPLNMYANGLLRRRACVEGGINALGDRTFGALQQ